MYQLKQREDGSIGFLLRSGEDFVRSKMSFVMAAMLVKDGKRTKSPFDEYPVAINDEWFFEGVEVKSNKKKK